MYYAYEVVAMLVDKIAVKFNVSKLIGSVLLKENVLCEE